MCSRSRAHTSISSNQRIMLLFASEPNSIFWYEWHQVGGPLLEPGLNAVGSRWQRSKTWCSPSVTNTLKKTAYKMICTEYLLNTGRRARNPPIQLGRTKGKKKRQKDKKKLGWDQCSWEGVVKEERNLHPEKLPDWQGHHLRWRDHRASEKSEAAGLGKAKQRREPHNPSVPLPPDTTAWDSWVGTLCWDPGSRGQFWGGD